MKTQKNSLHTLAIVLSNTCRFWIFERDSKSTSFDSGLIIQVERQGEFKADSYDLHLCDSYDSTVLCEVGPSVKIRLVSGWRGDLVFVVSFEIFKCRCQTGSWI